MRMWWISLVFLAGLLLVGCEGTRDSHVQSAQRYMERSQWKAALDDFNKALSLGEDSPETYNNIGVTLYWLGEYDQAISSFTRATMLKPQFPQAFNNRGLAYYQKGDMQKAVDDYSFAIKLDTQYPEPYYNRAVVYQAQGKKAEALADYEFFVSVSKDARLVEQAKKEIAKLKT